MRDCRERAATKDSMEDKLRCVERLLETIERDGIEMSRETLDGYSWLVCGCSATHAEELQMQE